MRNHRMFSTKLITDDRFTTLHPAAQILYIRLIAVADDEGFVSNLRMLVPRRSSLTPLVSAGLLHIFDTGPALILHWFAHNAVKSTHMKQTLYQAEKALVILDEHKIYRLKTEEEKSGILPSKEKKREEKKSKEKEREEKESKEKETETADAAASGGARSDTDMDKNFHLFWDSYPKKIDEADTRKVFMETQEDFKVIMEGLEHHKKCNQWVSDNGFFIPDPKNWLKKQGWKNRPPLYMPKTQSVPNGAASASGYLGPEELAAIQRVLLEP